MSKHIEWYASYFVILVLLFPKYFFLTTAFLLLIYLQDA